MVKCIMFLSGLFVFYVFIIYMKFCFPYTYLTVLIIYNLIIVLSVVQTFSYRTIGPLNILHFFVIFPPAIKMSDIDFHSFVF